MNRRRAIVIAVSAVTGVASILNPTSAHAAQPVSAAAMTGTTPEG